MVTASRAAARRLSWGRLAPRSSQKPLAPSKARRSCNHRAARRWVGTTGRLHGSAGGTQQGAGGSRLARAAGVFVSGLSGAGRRAGRLAEVSNLQLLSARLFASPVPSLGHPPPHQLSLRLSQAPSAHHDGPHLCLWRVRDDPAPRRTHPCSAQGARPVRAQPVQAALPDLLPPLDRLLLHRVHHPRRVQVRFPPLMCRLDEGAAAGSCLCAEVGG